MSASTLRQIVEKQHPELFWDPSKPRPGREYMPEWRRHLSLQHYFDPKLSGRFKTSALFGNRDSRLPCLVEGILPGKGIVGLIGDQQSFKTFLATDLALHVSFGRPWFGRKVSKGAVVYISAEAPEANQDIRNAWSKAHPEFVDSGQFMPIDSSPELGTKNGDAADLIAFIRQEIGVPRLIIIDTVSKVLHGESEDKEGMLALMANAEKISEAFDCVVLFPHHTKRGEMRARGASQFENNAQGRLTLRRRVRDMSAILTVARLKGFAEGERILLRMSEPIDLDRREHGKPATSLVIESAEKAPEPKEPKAEINPETGEIRSTKQKAMSPAEKQRAYRERKANATANELLQPA
jgi:hypothetical protein